MAVTPNYGWPVPVATDYVKDGWEAISDLGNAIDTTVAGIGSGLNLITPTSIVKGASGTASVSANGGVTFSGTEQISLNGVFSATYKNYRIVTNQTAGTNIAILCRFRTSGTDYSSSNYYNAGFYTRDNGGTGSSWAGNAGYFQLGYTEPNSSTFSGDIFDPFASAYTSVNGIAITGISGSVTNSTIYMGTRIVVTNSFDGLTLYPFSGTMSGNVSIYGYNI